jgi:hypothetical protein
MIVQRLLALLVTGFTLAAHGDPSRDHWYVGVALGKAEVEEFRSNSVRHDFILGWRPWRYFGVEGSYINLGRYEDPTAPDPLLLINGFGGAALGLLPLDERRTLLVRYGLHKLDIEHDYEGYEPALARIVGLGADWMLPKQLTARIEFQSIYGITDRHAAGKYQALSLTAGLFYRF